MKEKTIIDPKNFKLVVRPNGQIDMDVIIHDFGFRGETPEMKLKKERNVKLEDLLA